MPMGAIAGRQLRNVLATSTIEPFEIEPIHRRGPGNGLDGTKIAAVEKAACATTVASTGSAGTFHRRI
jgi:hypothetical protein